MKFCAFCGSYMDDSATVCPSCHTSENSSLQQIQGYTPTFSQAGTDPAASSWRNPENYDLETSFQPMDSFNQPQGKYRESLSETAVIQQAQETPEVLDFQKYPRPYSSSYGQKSDRSDVWKKGFSIFCCVMMVLYSVYLVMSAVNVSDYMAHSLMVTSDLNWYVIALIMTALQITGFWLCRKGSRKGAVFLLIATLGVMAAEYQMGYSFGTGSSKTAFGFLSEHIFENAAALLTAAMAMTGLFRQSDLSKESSKC